jgi:preprotein translocase subunit SecB
MNENEAAGPVGVAVRVVAQYVKDLSFENPQSPGSLMGGNVAPTIEASVDVAAKRLGEADFESELKVTVRARRGEVTVFLVELVYGALFQIQNAPPELLEPILLIECPRLIFPFARRVVADVTRDGGFAPLLIDPIDFASLYQNQRAAREAGPVGTA